MDIEEIHRLIELMNENELLELELVEDSKKIRLKKKYEGGAKVIPMAAGPVPQAAPAAAPAPAASEAAPAASGPPEGTVEIKSPMVGTFYRASNPESPPYVEEGDEVTKDTVVCIVEAMKVFNEIKAEMDGTIVSILCENGDTVEYGQPMFIVKPS
jgi:acetyl-CoA carboxylase biotin carboxyl carrier protein